MHKLIIVLIAIIVSAAAAAAGVYYGGDALSGGATKARAQTILAQMEQIASAAQVYTNENGGTKPGTVAALVNAKYLNQAPTPPNTGGATGYSILLSGGHGYVALLLGLGAESTCLEIAKMASGSVSSVPPMASDMSAAQTVGDMNTLGAFNSHVFNCATSTVGGVTYTVSVTGEENGAIVNAGGNTVAAYRF